MFEVRKLDNQIPEAQNETPAVKAGESANKNFVSAIVADRAPCAGIVPRNFDSHLAMLSDQAAAVKVAQVTNVATTAFAHQASATAAQGAIDAMRKAVQP